MTRFALADMEAGQRAVLLFERGAPENVYRALLAALDELEIATAAERAGAPRLSIDHIANTPDLTAGEVRIRPGEGAGGQRHSGHFGVWSAAAVSVVAALRQLLYMTAVAAIRWNSDSRACYQRLITSGKPPKVALVAVMRKLASLLNILLREDRLW